jgi:DNA-binding MarR family transcriptional regulator
MDAEALSALDLVAVGSVALTERAVSEEGVELTLAQWRVLVILGEAEEGATVKEIAGRMSSNHSAVSRFVARMRRRGLVWANKDDRDARVTRVRLTVEGRGLRTAVLERREGYLRAVLDQAGAIDSDTLKRIARSLVSFS